MPYSDREQQKQYQREWMARRRSDWIASQGGKCVACDSTDRLEVDHVDPATKAMNPTKVWSLSRAKREAELAKCQVLCFDCHKAKSYPETPIKHGTCGGYQYRKCRCVLCRGWNAERNRRNRARQYEAAAPTRKAA